MADEQVRAVKGVAGYESRKRPYRTLLVHTRKLPRHRDVVTGTQNVLCQLPHAKSLWPRSQC